LAPLLLFQEVKNIISAILQIYSNVPCTVEEMWEEAMAKGAIVPLGCTGYYSSSHLKQKPI
jgi:hypothetical protein